MLCQPPGKINQSGLVSDAKDRPLDLGHAVAFKVGSGNALLEHTGAGSENNLMLGIAN
jgi:hypothetical protein